MIPPNEGLNSTSVRLVRTLRGVLETQVQTEDQGSRPTALLASLHKWHMSLKNAPALAALRGCPEVLAPLQLSQFSLQSDEARAQSATLGNNSNVSGSV